MSRERGEELAIEYGIKFMETSAKASINVEESFFNLARDIKAKMEKKIVSLLSLLNGHSGDPINRLVRYSNVKMNGPLFT